MRFDDFGRSLGFAFVAAAGAPAVWLLAGPGPGVTLYWIALTALYALGLAPGHGVGRRTRGIAAAVAVAAAGALAAAVGARSVGIAVASTIALSAVRAAWLLPGRGAAAWWIEGAIGLGSLGLAGWLMRSALATSHGGALALGAAIWGYLLVQSVFWLAADPRAGSGRERDGFERARRRLVQLLDELS